MNQEEFEMISLPDETLPSSIPLPTETTEEQVTTTPSSIPLPMETTEEQVMALPSPAVETQPVPLCRSTTIRKSPARLKDYIRSHLILKKHLSQLSIFRFCWNILPYKNIYLNFILLFRFFVLF